MKLNLLNKRTELIDNIDVTISVFEINKEHISYEFEYIGEPPLTTTEMFSYLDYCKTNFSDATLGYADFLVKNNLDNNNYTLYDYKCKNKQGLIYNKLLNGNKNDNCLLF